ncbi:MAG: AtzH-like domain-containing protein [Nocardioides sp.]
MTTAPVDRDADVLACFHAYEEALADNDIDAMNHWFSAGDSVVRFGVGEEQWGGGAVRLWRRTANPVRPGRTRSETRVTWCGEDVAVVSTLFHYPDQQDVGRQSQVWQRAGDSWQVVHAHVSMRAATGADTARAEDR